jgi:hypothetical protein
MNIAKKTNRSVHHSLPRDAFGNLVDTEREFVYLCARAQEDLQIEKKRRIFADSEIRESYAT